MTALTEEQRAAAAQALLDAEINRAPIDAISTTYPEADVEDAYRISMAVTELKVARGRTIKGHEIAFVLGAPLSGSDNNAADVIRATDFVLPAIEIVDTRYRGYGTNLLVDSVADAASCGLVVLGSRPMRLTDLDLRREGAALYKNGTVEESGVAAAVMGNPVNAVVWLANKLGEFGVPMEAGNVILSGSFLKAIPFAAGDTISALFDTLGDVTFATA